MVEKKGMRGQGSTLILLFDVLHMLRHSLLQLLRIPTDVDTRAVEIRNLIDNIRILKTGDLSLVFENKNCLKVLCLLDEMKSLGSRF